MEKLDEKEGLIDLLLEPLSKSHILRIVALLEAKPQLIGIAVSIAGSEKYKEAMPAAWLLSHLWDHHPKLLQAFQNELVDLVLKTDFDSVRRSLLRILDGMPLQENQMGLLFDPCLEWMISERIAIAVRCNAMQILYKICLAEPELATEVKQTIMSLLEFGTAGFKSRGNKIVRQLSLIERRSL